MTIDETRIANEARRVAKITKRKDDKANWQEAVENLKIFPATTYDASRLRWTDNALNGNAFGILTTRYTRPSVDWHTCRETFEREMFDRGSTHGNFQFGFLLRLMEGQEFRVPNFIRNIEVERLNLPELTTFMRVHHEGRTTLTYIRPSSFWTGCSMRFSLFTILCRAGQNYFFNTIEDALMSYEYSRETFAAINLFLNHGRRRYTGGATVWNRKWVYAYRNLHESQVNTLAA